jgi:hypothetical protein
VTARTAAAPATAEENERASHPVGWLLALLRLRPSQRVAAACAARCLRSIRNINRAVSEMQMRCEEMAARTDPVRIFFFNLLHRTPVSLNIRARCEVWYRS